MTTDQLLKLVTLDKAALKAASVFIGLPKLGDNISSDQAVLLVVLDLLNAKGFDKEHQYAIVRIIKDDVTAYVTDPKDKFIALQVIDYNYVALPNWVKPYDYKSMEHIDALPNQPITSDCISITAIYNRLIKPLING
jgi:hypothetical protein